MNIVDLEEGWMKRQFDRAAKEIENWPVEMKMLVPEWWHCCGIGYPYDVTQCTKCGKIDVTH